MSRTLRTNKVIKMAETLKFFGDVSRCVLVLLLQKQKQGLYVHEIAEALEITHSAASHQLASLEVRGVVEGLREGQLVRYSLAKTTAAKTAVRLLKVLG